MKSKLFAVLSSLLLSSLASDSKAQNSNNEKRLARYVVLISIDGLRPEFYLDQSWPAPNLQYLKNNGAHAKGVRGVFPTVTYPSHTTVITGAFPAKHGIYYNTIFSDSGSTNTWYREAELIKTPTLWDVVKTAGLTSACISWPVSVGAPVDYNVPEAWVNNGNSINPHVTPAGLFEEIQQEATGKLTYDKMNLNNLAIDENLSRIASYLIKKYKPNFTTLHIVCVDHAEHSVGREGEEVKKALASADHAVSNILEAITAAGIKDSTAIIITGDHGFVDVNTSFSPNVLLAQRGLMSTGARGEWKAMFHSAGGSAFLHLKNRNDQRTLAAVKNMLDSLPASVKKLFRIVERAELDKIGADPNAALAIAPVEGVSVSGSAGGELVRAGRGGTHGYFPEFSNIETGFVAFGAGINNGAVVPKMGLEDIAPVIARLLALPFKAPDGILLPGIIKQPQGNREQRAVINGNINARPADQ
ncbi:alkaline phosphatase family protein [Sediminibacterium ginsengisoli]|uniref:Predicted pyrophosphatase or phosphodiesterase, AlkP superfamily n=1 Tax=Sediminibacterium ginsengisoli TaxID=413434 RepID=A0A1T4K996_9BACT|nr:ectonucleotide pyrophosphatase/phosphodiesterase [Sediminibacterium ginsengisoli]SJZ38981.1 Predicted pyrophosphatase or phosphodiesterase, AlkP superfamily [Sediminibacterium ginsengisoli]